MKIFTVGYEGRKIEDFLKLLVEHGVGLLIDIRANPNSRRKEFSKKNLAEALEKSGIDYEHIPEVGGPKWLRDKVKQDDDYGYFFREYGKFLESRSGELERISLLAKSYSACLLCYEMDYNRCHRLAVAEAAAGLSAGNAKIIHL